MTTEEPVEFIETESEPDSDTFRERRTFLAKMRHELRTPLNAIIGYSEMMLEDAEDTDVCPEGFITCLRNVHSGGNRMLGTVNEILDATRIESLHDTYDIAELGKSLQVRLGESLKTVLDCCESLSRTAEELKLEEFITDIGSIRSAAGILQGQVEEFVASSDISEDISEIPKDIHCNPDDTASLARNAVDSMTSSAIRPGRDAVGGMLLVVDDNEMNRAVLSRYLIRKGYQAEVAENGYQALEMLKLHGFDMVLLDIMMPGINGFQVLEILKKDEGLRDIPVIMISALDELESVVKCIEMGAEDYLPKPFEPVLLSARIGACLEKKRLHDREKEYIRQLRAEQEKSEKLLLNILPKEIADRLRQGESNIADSFSEVTVLFMDIVGFTELSGKISPKQLVELMNAIFSAFDRLTESHGLEKIKTIGDAYMVVGGLPLPRPDHAAAIAEMALDMCDEIERLNKEMNRSFRIRIGINTGPVVAGVIGIKKFTYDLWGRAVNLASRMESHGIPGCIQMTSETYELLKDAYCFEKRGPIHIKGEGEMTTWLLNGRKS